MIDIGYIIAKLLAKVTHNHNYILNYLRNKGLVIGGGVMFAVIFQKRSLLKTN